MHISQRLRAIQLHSAIGGIAFGLTHRLAEGDPTKEILRAAEEVKCDLIVLDTQGRTGLRRSVAANVLRRAPCPVVTVGPTARGAAQAPTE